MLNKYADSDLRSKCCDGVGLWWYIMDWIKWVVNILERQRKPTTVDITNSRFGRIRVCCTFFGFFPLARQHHQWLNVLLGRSDLKIKPLVVVLLLDINQYVPLHAHSYNVTTLDGKCIWTLERQQKRLSSQLLWIKPKNSRREHSDENSIDNKDNEWSLVPT